MTASGATDTEEPPRTVDPYAGKWRAFAAIGAALVANVLSMSMIYVALPSIADDFGVTLRGVAWVVIVNSLIISALLLPMGRLADLVGRRRMHLAGLTLFGLGALAVALAPTFELLIGARAVMSIGSSMGQSVGTAMVVAVFPPGERGKAIGSQTTAVAIGGASGPIFGGLVLEVLDWEWLFLLLLVPVVVALVAGFVVLDDEQVGSPSGPDRPAFDRTGAALSAVAVVVLVLTLNNPLALAWTSPVVVGGAVLFAALAAVWIGWERRTPEPMLDLALFQDRGFSAAVGARLCGFMGSTVLFLLAPVYLISLRSMTEAAAAGVLFLSSVGMGTAAQVSGRLSDRLGGRTLSAAGFALMAAMALVLSTMDEATPLTLVMPTVLTIGLALGTWNVPNSSTIIGSVSAERHGVVGALTNLIRNLGNVTGQALASAIVVGVMAARGFDIPLSEVADSVGAGDAFVAGWQWTFRTVAALAVAGLVLTSATARRPVAAASG